MDWVALAEQTAKIVAGGSAALIPVYFVGRTGRRLWRDGSAIVADLREVIKEVKPNGGTSLRDAVDRVERLVAESALLGSQRWRAINDQATLGYAESDQGGGIVWANRTLRDMVGRDQVDMSGWGWLNAVTASMRDWVRDAWREAVAQASDYEEIVVFERHDGRSVCCKVRAARITRLDGSLSGHVLTVARCGDMVDARPCGACYTAHRFGIER